MQKEFSLNNSSSLYGRESINISAQCEEHQRLIAVIQRMRYLAGLLDHYYPYPTFNSLNKYLFVRQFKKLLCNLLAQAGRVYEFNDEARAVFVTNFIRVADDLLDLFVRTIRGEIFQTKYRHESDGSSIKYGRLVSYARLVCPQRVKQVEGEAKELFYAQLERRSRTFSH
jgi:hypothetical protein